MDKDSQTLWKNLIDTRRWERADALERHLESHHDESNSLGRLRTGLHIMEVEERCANELAERGHDWWLCCEQVLTAGQIAIDEKNIPQLEFVFAEEILKDHLNLFGHLESAVRRGGMRTGAGGRIDTAKERAKAQFRNYLALTRLSQRSRVLRLEELLGAPRYAGILKNWRAAAELTTGDPNGAVREAVSALEGAAKLLTRRKTATLGDVIKQLRASGAIAPLLLDAMEKVWAFANATPGVRHGSAVPADILQAELQFCLETTGSALRVMLVLDRPV